MAEPAKEIESGLYDRNLARPTVGWRRCCGVLAGLLLLVVDARADLATGQQAFKARDYGLAVQAFAPDLSLLGIATIAVTLAATAASLSEPQKRTANFIFAPFFNNSHAMPRVTISWLTPILQLSAATDLQDPHPHLLLGRSRLLLDISHVRLLLINPHPRLLLGRTRPRLILGSPHPFRRSLCLRWSLCLRQLLC
jgi:hypothetical protein